MQQQTGNDAQAQPYRKGVVGTFTYDAPDGFHSRGGLFAGTADADFEQLFAIVDEAAQVLKKFIPIHLGSVPGFGFHIAEGFPARIQG